MARVTIPKQLNHYTILESLGQGGMGEVFLAEDTRLHRRIAIKVLSGLSANPERRARFEREARAVAALNHPSIVTIHSVEESDGVPFLTMELIEGKLLSTLIAERMPLETLLRIGIGIADAVGAAHLRGITHRDLKPTNVMVTREGRVKVLDFGLAKVRDADTPGEAGATRILGHDLTGEGRIIGTVAYMSPEQAEGKPVDQRSDIFSLGVLLHEMATGERPFKGDTNVSLMSAILRDTPTPITDINPSLPPGLAKIVRKSLAKDPSRRYQTATDLRNDLEDLKTDLDSAPTVVLSSASRHAVSRATPLRLPRLPWMMAAAVVLIALAGFGVYRWQAKARFARAAFELDRFSRLTSSGNAQIAAMSPDGRYVVHIKNEGVRPGLWIRQTATMSDVQIVPPADVRYDGLTFAPDANFIYYVTYGAGGGVASLYRIPVLGGPPQRVLEDIDSRISFSPDATQFAFMRGAPSEGRNYLMVAGVNGDNARKVTGLEAPDQIQLTAPSWSPDGRTILVGVQSLRDGPHHACFAVDVATGTARMIGGKWTFTNDLEWLPDGRSFVVSATELGGQSVQLWQVMYPDGRRRRVTNDLNNYIGVSIARDGLSMATVQVEATSNVWVVPIEPGESPVQVTSGQGRGDGLAGLGWTQDGHILFSSQASGRQQIWIMDGDGSNQRQLTSGEEPSLAPAATPDGRYVVYQQAQAEGMYLYRIAPDGAGAQQLTTGGAEFAPIVSRDSQWVFYNSPLSGQSRPFKVSVDGGAPVSLSDMFFRPYDVSPDGSELLGLTWDPQLRRSRLATLPTAGGKPAMLPIEVGNYALWSRDGKNLTYVDLQSGAANVWATDPRGGGTPRQLTHFPPGSSFFAASWSFDGRRLAVARGPRSSDVVIVTAKER